MGIRGGHEFLVCSRMPVLAFSLFLAAFLAKPTDGFAQPAGFSAAGQTAEDAFPGSAGPAAFRFNDLYTTPFGPAYADIWLAQQNFLSCRPPVGRAFSYALCYFSGPAVPTPVASSAGPTGNPALPCVLSPDGKSATCTCYEIKTEQYPPVVPYL